MALIWRLRTGRLVLRKDYCSVSQGKWPKQREIPLFMDGFASGAAWTDGFLAARSYFASHLGKCDSDEISFYGANCTDGELNLMIVLDPRVAPVESREELA